jgi:Fe-S-cluster containining protein
MIRLVKDPIDSPVPVVFIQRLKQIYATMDHAYAMAANNYGFSCDGCGDNCCRTRFYHHTMIEYAYVKEGLMSLRAEMQNQLRLRALSVSETVEKSAGRQEAVKLMCPLNFDTRCILYAYRPMICRLHGIPHELKKPGQPGTSGPGCSTFDDRCGQKPYIPFDRTPVYRDMAKLEQAVRQATGIEGKIRMTIAEMILDFRS